MKVVGDVEYQAKVCTGLGHGFDWTLSPNYNDESAADADDRLRRFLAKYPRR